MSPVLSELEVSSAMAGPPPACAQEEERDALILAHMDDVRQIARSVVRRLPANVQLDDLVQAGMLGLLDAASRYDRGRHMMFRQYARIRITGAIFDSLRELDWASRHLRTRKQKLDQTTRALEARLGRAPNSEELAEALSMDLDNYFEFANAVREWKQVDIDAEPDDEHRPLLDQLATRPEDAPDAGLLCEERSAELRRAVSELPEGERQVLTLYYFDGLTMEAIAQRIGRTESRVSQIRARAVARLQNKLRDTLGPGSTPDRRTATNLSIRIQ